MGRVSKNLSYRFRKVGSRTPLYHDENQKLYWTHCWYCGIELIYDKKIKRLKSNSFTRDHVHPASIGGGKGSNTVPACNKCNKQKRNLSLEEFRIVNFGGHGGKFYAEQREDELKAKLEKKEIRPTLRAQLSAIVGPSKVIYRPPPVRCMFYREQFITTPLLRILMRLFS